MHTKAALSAILGVTVGILATGCDCSDTEIHRLVSESITAAREAFRQSQAGDTFGDILDSIERES